MKRKTCIICQTKLKYPQQLFCSNDCYEKGKEIQKKEQDFLRVEKENLKRLHENTECETEVLYTKKQNLILKESVNFDVPFIRIQEERYRKVDKTDNEGIVLPVDSDLIAL